MIYIDEIKIGEIYHSNWVEYVFSSPSFHYNYINGECYFDKNSNPDRSGFVIVQEISPWLVICTGRNDGKPYGFEVLNGMVKLNRVMT